MYPTYQFTAPSSSGGSIASANYDSPLSGLSSGSRDTSTSPPSPDELAQTLGLDDWKDWIDFHDGESDQAAAQPTFFPVLDPQLPVSSPLEFVNLPQAEGLSKAPLLDPLAGVDLSTFPFAATHLPATPTLGGAQAGFLPLQSIPEVAPFTAVPKAPSNFDLAPPLASDAAAFAADDASRLPSKKRKLGSTHEGSASPEEPLDGGDRGSTERNAAHNTVERRYRNRLKDMIATLRDHIPSLQNMDPNEADRGLANQSVTKGLVLTQATQYIVELEARNKKLLDENAMLQRQVMVLGKLNGQLRAQCAALQRPGGGGGGGAMSKVMVGGLAGMLAMQGFSTAETSSDRPTGRGLFAVPVHLLQQGVRYLHGYRLPLIGDAVHLGSAVSLLRGVLLLSAAVYLFLPWVFSAAARPGRPPSLKPGKRQEAEAEAQTEARRLATPGATSLQEVRQSAFLTASQGLRLPRGGFELWAALAGQLALGMLRSLGIVRGEQDPSSAKAWDVATDAQLTGGDGETTTARLFLAFVAVGSLPATPYRSMLRAMYAQVISTSASGWWWGPLKSWLGGASQRLWKRAQTLEAAASKGGPAGTDGGGGGGGGEERLAQHLKALLEWDVDDVFTEEVVQKASAVAFGHSRTSDDDDEEEEEEEDAPDWEDAIVADDAVVSPLDVLSAWHSATVLRSLLAAGPSSLDDRGKTREDLDLVLRLAPPGSVGWARGLVARALLVTEGQERRRDIAQAFQALVSSSSQRFVSADRTLGSAGRGSSSGPRPLASDLALALRCAIALDRLRSEESDKALQALAQYVDARPDQEDARVPTTFGVVALYVFLRALYDDKGLAGRHRGLCETIGGLLRLSVRGDGGCDGVRLDEAAEESVASLSVEVLEWLVGLQDEGGGQA